MSANVPDPQSEARIPGADDFNSRAVYRAVLTDTLQHPATILPAAVSAVGGLYLGLIGLDPMAFAVTFGSALVATGAWIVNYFLRGEALAEKHVEELREQRRRLQEQQRQSRLGEAFDLAAEWQALGHAEGMQQARELGEAYRQLEDYLKQRITQDKSSSLSVQRLAVLAEDTYYEGMAILRKALDLCRALSQMDKAKLERELGDWRAELGALRLITQPTDVQKTQMQSLGTRVAAHEKRLELHDQHTQTLHQLLAQSEQLEAALESTNLEAADLSNADVLLSTGHSASELERAVNAARRVEERLRGSLETNHEEDEIYLSAGDQPG